MMNYSTEVEQLAVQQQQQQQKYFGELLGYESSRLKSEPGKLARDVEDAKKRLDDCISGSYDVYLNTHVTMKELGRVLGECSHVLDKVEEEDIPSLHSHVSTFRGQAMKENATRESLRQLYTHQATILDILEVPSLMDTCVRAGNYDEALELKAFGKKLKMIHGGSQGKQEAVIDMLMEEIDQVTKVMLEQLWEKLQSSIQLAECLQVVGYIKRLLVFSDVNIEETTAKIKKEFLERRGCWIDSSLKELGDSLPPYEYLKKLTDIYRLQMFDILMQYRAIFYPKEGNLLLNDPCFSWSYRRVMFYLIEVQGHLSQIEDGGSLASVLDHCMYCGKALARLGLDFRPAIFPMFEEAAIGIFEELVSVSDDVFADMIATHRWVAIPSLSSSLTNNKSSVEQESGLDGDNKSTDSLRPPIILVEHPPLAVYTNGILAALNELRHCAPLSIKDKVGILLQNSFDRLVSVMLERKMVALSEDESAVFQKACSIVASIQLPFLVECYSSIFGSPGLTILPDDKMKKMVSTDE